MRASQLSFSYSSPSPTFSLFFFLIRRHYFYYVLSPFSTHADIFKLTLPKNRNLAPHSSCQYIQIHYLLMRAKWYNKVVAPALVGHTTIAKSFPYYESVGTVISEKYSKYQLWYSFTPEKNKLLSTEPMF